MDHLEDDLEDVCTNLVRLLTTGTKRPDSLKTTPHRLAEAWEYWTLGYDQNPRTILKEFNEFNGKEEGPFDEMVMQSGIRFYSHCEHHLAPFWGVVAVGYIPRDCKYIVGLSKLSRLVDCFARRLQIQERLTVEIAKAMMDLDHQGVGVVVQARHMCMESRGVRQPGTITTTSALLGCIKEHPGARQEFLSFANAHTWNGV